MKKSINNAEYFMLFYYNTYVPNIFIFLKTKLSRD